MFVILQLLAAFAVSMGSLIVGFTSGYTSPALPKMNVTLSLSHEEVNIILEKPTSKHYLFARWTIFQQKNRSQMSYGVIM